MYKEIQKQRFLPSRNQVVKATNPPISSSSNSATSEITYAQVTRSSLEIDNASNNSNSHALLIEMREMMSMTKHMMGQIAAMTNPIINLMPKQPSCP